MQFDIWTQSLLTAMNTLWGKLAGFIPNLLGALVVVLLGFVIAKRSMRCFPSCWPSWAWTG